ncbi:MAG: hypothetical protein QOJ38_1526, partial [Solirubrobacterales bacterium]|nr:hypothetical protein [Solirubrobacterales bacterium]
GQADLLPLAERGGDRLEDGIEGVGGLPAALKARVGGESAQELGSGHRANLEDGFPVNFR